MDGKKLGNPSRRRADRRDLGCSLKHRPGREFASAILRRLESPEKPGIAQRPYILDRDHARVFACFDRTSVVSGKSVSVRVDLGGRLIINTKKKKNHSRHHMNDTL